jgi:hypothetical protein
MKPIPNRRPFALILGTLLTATSLFARSEDAKTTATREIGEHEQIILFKKSVNPQNLLLVYTKVNPDCTFKQDPQAGHVVFDFYWLMDGTRYKPVASAIKAEINKRLEALPSQNLNSFSVAVRDLNQVVTDIPENKWKIDVTSAKVGRECVIKAFMNLGASSKNVRLQLKQIYSDASANIFTRSVTVRSLTLSGIDAATGAPFEQTYKGR